MNNLEKITAKLKIENTEKQKKIQQLITANEEYREFNNELKQFNTAQEALLQTLKEEKKRHQGQKATRKPPTPKPETITQTRSLEARPTYATQSAKHKTVTRKGSNGPQEPMTRKLE